MVSFARRISLWVPILIFFLAASPACRPRQGAFSAGKPSQPAAPAVVEDPPPKDSPRWLESGVPTERQLVGRESHDYLIALHAEDYIQVVVDQRGIDVMVTLYDPSGRDLLEVDSPTGVWGPESVFAVADTAGTYRVEVRPWLEKASGRYSASVGTLRPATEKDRTRSRAASAFFAGERLLQQGKAEALRSALAKYQRALSLWSAVGEPYQEALVERKLGQLRYRLGEIRPALVHYERALELVTALGRREQEAGLLNDIGYAYSLTGSPRKAREAHEEALRIASALDDRYEVVVCLNNLALVSKSTGELWEALLLYDRALKGWRELHDRAAEALTLHNIGSLYILLDRLPEAEDVLNRALKIQRSINNTGGEATILTTIGWVHLSAEDMDTALDDFTTALRLKQLVGDRRGQAMALDRIGTTYMKSGRFEEALGAYGKALEISRDIGDSLDEAQTLNNLGELFELRGEPQRAVSLHGAALRLFQAIEEPSGEAYSLFRRAHAERICENFLAARSDIETAIEIIESLRLAARSQALSSSYFASVYDYYELSIDILMRLHTQDPAKGFDRLALEAGERSRARSLLETLAEARLAPGAVVDASLAERSRSLKRTINAKERERLDLLASEPSQKELETFETELRDLLLEHEKIRTKVRDVSRVQADLPWAEPLGVQEIQQQVLDEETLLLIYTLGEERSFLHLVSRSRVAAYELPSRAEIESMALRFHTLLARSQKRQVKVQARLAAAALGEVLLGPVAEQLGARRLVVVADGALQYVPFAALVAPPTRERTSEALDPLVVAHEIVHLPSASVLAVLRRELAGRRSAPKTLAVFADPVFDRDDPRIGKISSEAAHRIPGPIAELERSAGDFGLNGFVRLPASHREADALLAMVPTGESLEAVGFAANRETITSGRLAQYRIIHFATHGLVHAKHPELSGIVLSLVDKAGRQRDGFLRAYEIYGLDLPADLVVLSACRTALGKSVRGEGQLGLTRGFLHAGAARVVVSLWNANDQGTAELMQRFYHGILRKGLRPAAALRAAQVSMLRDPRWEEPYYWATFTLQGEWR